ncbi:hypothetical protein [Flavobacterium sp.]|jgi:hypothetical protein|uniref:hypothetical protein n=1 Tax=Flavobacterium sp. TaxID=239 RepID=UPI0037C11745
MQNPKNYSKNVPQFVNTMAAWAGIWQSALQRLMLSCNAIVAKCGRFYARTLKKGFLALIGGFSKSATSGAPRQPLDYVKKPSRNGRLETEAKTVTGENWD